MPDIKDDWQQTKDGFRKRVIDPDPLVHDDLWVVEVPNSEPSSPSSQREVDERDVFGAQDVSEV